jgi:Domain of unknown function (DUF4381)
MDTQPTAPISSPTGPGGQATGLLEQLRDIGAPDPAPWFPPAPGWWAIAAIAVLAGFLAYRFFRGRSQRNRYRMEAGLLLDALHADWQRDRDDRAYASAVHQLVRRVAIHNAGRERIARLTGPSFIESVNTLSRVDLSERAGAMLSESSYRREADFDVELVHREVEAWLDELEGPGRA